MSDGKLSRRQLILTGGAGLASVTLLGGVAAAGGEPHHAPEVAGSPMQKLPWAYKTPLDPTVSAERAFAGYSKGHCMYGSFEAMVGAVAQQLGAPYTSFPFDMMTYGAGGIEGWGTVCGALSGAAAAFKILSPKPEPLVDALFGWYETEPLPDYVPKAAKFANVKSVAGSPLCHQSVTHWCAASGKKTYTAERKERCGVITAAVARKAVMLLNDQFAGRALPVISGAAQKCGACHEKGGALENTRGKMSCSGCHHELGAKHPAI